MKKTKNQINLEKLKKDLLKKQKQAETKLAKKFPHLKKYMKEKNLDLYSLRQKSANLIGLGALTAAVAFSPLQDNLKFPIPKEIVEKLKNKKNTSPDTTARQFLVEALGSLLPPKPRPLTSDEEKYLENLLSHFLGINAKTNLEGNHLNTVYGYIGAEQHLRRYPGDILANHGSPEIQRSGIAPGRGAWGFFAPSSLKMTPEFEEIERWYAVVQTMYLPDWNTNTKYLREWYKYRKVLIVNTQNGNAVVASIADAGPAAWTGKHFGGSPEVMHTLGGPKYKKGAVVVLFIEDPQNQIALGPVTVTNQDSWALALNTNE